VGKKINTCKFERKILRDEVEKENWAEKGWEKRKDRLGRDEGSTRVGKNPK